MYLDQSNILTYRSKKFNEYSFCRFDNVGFCLIDIYNNAVICNNRLSRYDEKNDRHRCYIATTIQEEPLLQRKSQKQLK